jgi:hypothetical protein
MVLNSLGRTDIALSISITVDGTSVLPYWLAMCSRVTIDNAILSTASEANVVRRLVKA